MTESSPKKNRLTAEDVILSPVEERDLISIAQGYYKAFAPSWHDQMEPKDGLPALDVRVERFAKRMKPWLTSPHGRWIKATLVDQPDLVIGHAGWLQPCTSGHVINHFRRDAAEKLGWRNQEGWSIEEEEVWWSHVDPQAWQPLFLDMDTVREELMRGKPHWFLAPLWVIPEFQGRGVASLLLKDTLDIADAQQPSFPVYLEAMPEARPIYEHFGFIGIEGKPMQMIRHGPMKVAG